MSESRMDGRVVAGRYRLAEPLGRGGMGVVWRAHDEVLDRVVAVKELLIPPQITDEERSNFNRRTLREARAAGRLNHPGVIVVHDVIEEDGRPWIVMQLVDSRSLGQILKDEGPLPPGKVADIGLQVLGALKAAHDSGVLHRDVKPENVLISEDGRVVLTDFGIATMEEETSLTRTGTLLGTPSYIPPERVRGGAAQRESDLWSLGATLYAAVEGRPPHDRGSPLPTIAAVLNDEPDPPKLAGPLAPVLMGLLRKDPEQRMEFAEAARLLALARGDSPQRATRPISAPAPTSVLPGAGEEARKRPLLAPWRRAPEAAAPAAASAAAASAAPAPPSPAPEAAPGDAKPYGETPAAHRESPTRPSPRGEEESPARPAPEPARATPPAPAVRPEKAADEPPARRDTPPEPVEPPERTGASPLRRGLWVAVPAAVLVAVIAGYLGVKSAQEQPRSNATQPAATSPAQQPPAGGSPSSQAAQTASPAPTPTPSPKDEGVPEGWRIHKDRTFSVALPKDWRVWKRSGPQTFFRDPDDTSRYLLIEYTTNVKSDPVKDWKDQEPVARPRFPGYKRIRIDRVDYMKEAADWEFTFDGRGGRTRVLNRGFVANDTYGFAIYWSAPERTWEEDYHHFETFARTFKAAGD
ncbi:serine/threonine-protein kinase [Bailinhaonella thermotolerans]|uniref:non-specific serine/threonine protein kinase n=1 Tax=Bailinhaonella thermotolerans TaxID=1070861 RepID=A0A3A4AQ89_9ACTN|nr:serine/threonine-protein kinase [Bailinhaonella thermotolerans]RJL31221.1 serine/threonine protein kinase [Bailinhaonella thermotolerans]